MRQLIGLIIFSTILISCTESFKKINPESFNKKIANRTDIESPEKLISLYSNIPSSESAKNRSVEITELDNDNFQITLIYKGLGDDSQSSEKIVMLAARNANKWTVLEIKKNWKCWKGRGHTNWGTGLCN